MTSQMEESTTSTQNSFVFETQGENEKLLLLLRAHFVTNLPWIFITVLLASVPFLVAFSRILEPIIKRLAIPQKSLDGFVLIWYLFVFAYSFQHFINWYFNVYVLTNRRIVDFDFFQILYKRVSSASLNNIEDVTVTTGGVSQVLFVYGNVFIQTAGEVAEFEFLKVPNPIKVKAAIEQAIEEDKNG